MRLESFRHSHMSSNLKRIDVQHENASEELDTIVSDEVADQQGDGSSNDDYATLRAMRKQLLDENVVEPLLPSMRLLPKARLNTSSERIFNDAETMGIQMTIGVLTAPRLLRTRLIPLLETSLRDEHDVHVFFADANRTLAGRQALQEYLVSVNRTKDVHIVPLKPPGRLLMSIRNAWVDLPALVHMHAVRPTQRWFAIVDDDTYFFTNAIRKILNDAELREDLDGQPVYMGAPITDGLKGGCRLVRNGKGTRPVRTTARKEVQFVCGGSGILINNIAVERLLATNKTNKRLVDYCMRKMLQPAGDVRLGDCMSEAKVPIVARREMFRDTVFLAIGEKAQYNKYEFPASFHRFRKREWFYAMRALTEVRAPNELVTWGDLILNFQPGPDYWLSYFYPQQYANYTLIYGINRRKSNPQRETTIKKKYGMNCAPKTNKDLW